MTKEKPKGYFDQDRQNNINLFKRQYLLCTQVTREKLCSKIHHKTDTHMSQDIKDTMKAYFGNVLHYSTL